VDPGKRREGGEREKKRKGVQIRVNININTPYF
jgi:hypothetical protein